MPNKIKLKMDSGRYRLALPEIEISGLYADIKRDGRTPSQGKQPLNVE